MNPRTASVAAAQPATETPLPQPLTARPDLSVDPDMICRIMARAFDAGVAQADADAMDEDDGAAAGHTAGLDALGLDCRDFESGHA